MPTTTATNATVLEPKVIKTGRELATYRSYLLGERQKLVGQLINHDSKYGDVVARRARENAYDKDHKVMMDQLGDIDKNLKQLELDALKEEPKK